MNTSISSIGC